MKYQRYRRRRPTGYSGQCSSQTTEGCPKGQSPKGNPGCGVDPKVGGKSIVPSLEGRSKHHHSPISDQRCQAMPIQFLSNNFFTVTTLKKLPQIPYSRFVTKFDVSETGIVWHIGRVLGFGIFAQGLILCVSGSHFSSFSPHKSYRGTSIQCSSCPG